MANTINATTEQTGARVEITTRHGDGTIAHLDETATVVLIEELVRTLPADSTVRELFANRFGL